MRRARLSNARGAQPNDPRFFHIDMQGTAFFDVRTGELELNPSDTTVALQRVDTCPNCGAEDDHFRTMQLSDGLVLPVVAETLLAALPVMPAPQRGWLPAGGRRLLAFSDSRSRAARSADADAQPRDPDGACGDPPCACQGRRRLWSYATAGA